MLLELGGEDIRPPDKHPGIPIIAALLEKSPGLFLQGLFLEARTGKKTSPAVFQDSFFP